MARRNFLLCALALLLSGGPAFAGGTLRDVLASALDSRQVPPDLSVHAGWKADSVTYRTLDVWGDGVGILDGRVQFRLPEEALLGLVRTLLDAGFPEMEAEAAGDEKKEQGLRIRSRVRVRAGGQERDVFRTVRGGPSPELDRLAGAIRALCEGPAASGVTASSLGDAIEKTRRGVLAPQALRVTFQQLSETADEQGVRAGWMLRIEGRDMEVRSVRLGEGAGPVESRRLSDREWRALVKALGKARLDAMPPALSSERYEDLSVGALGHERQVQARRFAGAPAGTNRAQKGYEKLRRVLSDLYDASIASPP